MTQLRASQRLVDATFKETLALGTADGTVQTTGFNLGALSARGARLADCELEVVAPALTTTELPDADTCTYSVETDDNSGFSSAKIIADKILVQTGAGAAGAATATVRFRLPSDCEQYVRVKAVLAGGTGDCSGKSLVASLVF